MTAFLSLLLSKKVTLSHRLLTKGPMTTERKAVMNDRTPKGDQASSFVTTLPCTSVSRKSRPWNRNVSLV